MINSLDQSAIEWISIQSGQVELNAQRVNLHGDGHIQGYLDTSEKRSFTLPSFDISKYLITNAQFEPFITAGGYDKSQYWTSDGWRVKNEGWALTDAGWKATGNSWTQPLYWQDEKWNQADYPLVGVSWYEAYAYTRWLSEVKSSTIQLPTEQQWQRAAQGDDGRTYPWGNKWDANRCNHNVDNQGLGKTSPVNHFPDGVSPYGVFDMAGNVWEWSLTDFRTGSDDAMGTNERVARGGSWTVNNPDFLGSIVRIRADAYDRFTQIGFRVCRNLS